MASRRDNEISLEKHEFREMRHGNRTKIAETVGVYFIVGILIALVIMMGFFCFKTYDTDVSVSLPLPNARTSFVITVQEQDDNYTVEGLVFTYVGSLRLQSNSSVIVGTAISFCCDVVANEMDYCIEQFIFNGQGGIPEGTLETAGTQLYMVKDVAHYAITGGTGYYHQATGDLVLSNILVGSQYLFDISVSWVN